MESSSNEGDNLSYLLPSFIKRIADPSIKSVLVAGCGGGFDFVHSMNLYPELHRMKKAVTIVSYSFGLVTLIKEAPLVWKRLGVMVKEVTSKSIPDADYGPEVHMVSYLDSQYPESAPHKIYACNAREFTVPLLHLFYSHLIKEHKVDAFIIFDGGTDSLMKGDEEGLGDPIEDCVSITDVSKLEGLKVKILISAGFGADRFNHVSDAASLRAVAEITGMGGFLGSISLEPDSPGFNFYCGCVKHIYDRQSFRSVLTGLIIASGKGHYGFDLPKSKKNSEGSDKNSVDVELEKRVKPGAAFVWPLMSMLFAFDVDVVVKRSLISKWIKEEETVNSCYYAMRRERLKLEDEKLLRGIENLPTHEQMRSK